MRPQYLFFIIIVFLTSCKELEDPISTTGDKVFYLQGKINGLNLNFAGGDSSNYHYTAHKLDEYNVYEFISEFKNEECPTCDDQLKITIRAHEQSAAGSINMNDALGKGNYEYLNNIVLPRHRSYRFKLDTSKVPIGSSSNILWEFGDGATSNEISPFHYYKEDGIKQVTLTYTNPSCTSRIIKDLPAIPDTFPTLCYSDFYYTINATQVKFFPVDTALVTSYLWDFGDGLTSTLPYPIHNYSSSTTYVITLTVVKDVLGCAYKVSRQLDFNQQNCELDFSFKPETPASVDSLNLSKVLVEYTTKEGDYYRSDVLPQDGFNFIISDVEPYFNNEKNEKTVRFSLQFNCELQNAIGNTILLDQFTGKVAVSYP